MYMAVQLTHLYFVWVFLVGLQSSSTQKSGEKTVIFAINLRIQTLSLFAESDHSACQYCTSLPKFSISWATVYIPLNLTSVGGNNEYKCRKGT